MECLTIELGRERVALPLEAVDQVVRMPRLGLLPEAAPGVLGCLNLRGEQVLVVDLFARLALGAEPIRASQVLVLVREQGLRVALRASRVDAVVSATPGPLPEGAGTMPCVKALLESAGPPVPLLDLAAVLRDEASRASAGRGAPE